MPKSVLTCLAVSAAGVALCCAVWAAPAHAKEVAQSGPSKVSLLEVFSSEGCSSCPPADEWLARFVDDPRLWKAYAPAVFHVDYWDSLGWKDAFGRRAFADRQRDYAHAWGEHNVYTPGVVLDGREWRDWWRAETMPEPPGGNAGMLRLDDLGKGLFEGTFEEGGAKGGIYVLHAALLGFGVHSDVKQGENAGKNLTHNFLVLDEAHIRMQKNPSGKIAGRLILNSPVRAPRRGIVVWVTRDKWTEPLQAAGTFI